MDSRKLKPVLVSLTYKEANALRDALLKNGHTNLANKFTKAINTAYPPEEPDDIADDIFGHREGEMGNDSGNEAHMIRQQYHGN